MRRPRLRVILSAVLVVSCVAVWNTQLTLAADPKEKAAAHHKGDPKHGKEKYMENMRCSACHGDNGKGDGPAAMALNPKPRNYTDCNVMGKESDAKLFKVIKEGGPAAGFSPLMVAFGSQLSDQDIWDIIAFIRSIPKPPCKITAKD